MNPYEVYRAYIALRLHFTSPYDFFKYKGAVRTSSDSYGKLPGHEVRTFEKISRLGESKTYLVGNFLFSGSTYINDFHDDPYIKYRRYLTNGFYLFKDEIKQLKVPYGQNFQVENSQTPYILYLFNNDKVSLYTLCVLQKAFKWIDKLDNPFFVDQCKIINKAIGFFKYDELNSKRQLIDNAKSVRYTD